MNPISEKVLQYIVLLAVLVLAPLSAEIEKV